MTQTLTVVGAQWGDEGKGKITNYLAAKAEVVVRYQGGTNAGHSINIGGECFKLHQIPSGIFYPDTLCVIGNGVVIDPALLLEELEELEQRGINTSNLKISERAHLVMPYHKKLDALQEQRLGEHGIGTTQRGIGPAYIDKAARCGLRAVDLFEPHSFAEKLSRLLKDKNEVLQKIYNSEDFCLDSIVEEYSYYAERLCPYIADTTVVLDRALQEGRSVLFEGAQGTMLDIDYGTYPYVTSSNPVAGGIITGAGIAPGRLGAILGIVKAYTTRVGEGPFVTEVKGKTAEYIRTAGKEFGTTTGRPRRIGWLDGVALRYARRLNGFEYLAVTLLDVLSGLENIKICTSYCYQGEKLYNFPSSLEVLRKCEPVYEELTGWDEDISGCRKVVELPEGARVYLKRLSELLNAKIAFISVGPQRESTIKVTTIPGFQR